MASNECVFCKIIRGELPVFKVYEDNKTFAFLDIHPVNPGHTLVVPKSPAARNLFDVPADDWAAISETVRKVAAAVHDGTGADGVNLMMNNREAAGQVVDHVHVHVIPRFKNDGLRPWPPHSYAEGEAEAVMQKIQAAL